MAAVRCILLLLLTAFSIFPFSFSLSETEALLKLKASFTNAAALSSWVPTSSPCKDKWQGVVCENGVVTGLRLSDMGLSGNVDVEALSQLPSLRSISFINNSFSGPIPDFHTLGALKAMFFTKNKFSGPIPSHYFSKLGSLKKLWISGNNFSGPIPDSLTQLSHLLELHLENNQFSGKIPPMNQNSLNSLDLSNNNLEGQIPQSLSKFEARSFGGNPGLCGKPLKECVLTAPQNGGASESNGSPQKTGSSDSGFFTTVIVVIFIALVLVLIIILSKKRNAREDDFSVLRREDVGEMVQVHISSSNHRAQEPIKKGSESKKGSNRGVPDLIMVNDEKGVFGLPDLMKAAAEVLGNGGLGSAYKAVMSTNGLSVVVKRLKEMNKMGRDGFDAKMKHFGRLKHLNILTPLAYHYRREEKLIISEYMPKGSLLYVLHGDRGISHSELNWPTRLKIIQGIARGMGFLHTEFAYYDLPHGNLKSSNVLLSGNYEALLCDYALHPLINPNNAHQALFAYKTPDYERSQQVSHKSDVYCLGIIILEILTGKFPSQYHSNGKGGTDVVQWVLTAISEGREREVIDPELKNDTSALNNMLQVLQIGAACTESNPNQRLSMKEAVRRIEEVQS